VTEAVEQARAAVKQSPDSALAQSALGYASWLALLIAGAGRPAMEEGKNAAAEAVIIDPRYYLGHSVLGCLQFGKNDHDLAMISLRRSIDANPSFPIAYNQMTSCLTAAGRPNEALQYISSLNRISPSDPMQGFYGCVRAMTWFFLRQDGAAIENAELSLSHHPGWAASELLLAAASHRVGELEQARAAGRRFVEANGQMSLVDLREFFGLRREADLHMIASQLTPLGVVMN
jgi:tetratricopeptide (TPR) repeat protein